MQGGQSPLLAPACQRVKNGVVKMATKKQVKKVQISIPYEQYQEIEDMWLDLGFSSVAEAGKFLLMNKVTEFYKQVKKSQTAITRLQDLKATSNNLKSSVAPVQQAGNQISKTLSAEQQTSGYIKKDSTEYKKIISGWQRQNPDCKEPQQVRGLRWWIDKETNKKKMVWWK